MRPAAITAMQTPGLTNTVGSTLDREADMSLIVSAIRVGWPTQPYVTTLGPDAKALVIGFADGDTNGRHERTGSTAIAVNRTSRPRAGRCRAAGGDQCCGRCQGQAGGRVTVKHAPPSAAGSAPIVPPIRVTRPCTSASPIPPTPTGRLPR